MFRFVGTVRIVKYVEALIYDVGIFKYGKLEFIISGGE